MPEEVAAAPAVVAPAPVVDPPVVITPQVITPAPAPVVPEKYELKKPKDSPLSDARIEKIAAFARKQGFSNEKAQELVEEQNQLLSEDRSERSNDYTKLADSWQTQAKSDKEIGGKNYDESVAMAKRVVEMFADDEFKRILTDKTARLGDNPYLIKIFSRIGRKYLSESKFVEGTQSTDKQRSMAERLYPNHAKEE